MALKSKEAYQEELPSLSFRLDLAYDLGAAVLDMADAFDSLENNRRFNRRLFKEQPDLYLTISALEGRINSIVFDGFPNTD